MNSEFIVLGRLVPTGVLAKAFTMVNSRYSKGRVGAFFPFNVHILPSSGSSGFSRSVLHKATVVPQLQLRSWVPDPKPSYYLDAFSCKILGDLFFHGVFKSFILFG